MAEHAARLGVVRRRPTVSVAAAVATTAVLMALGSALLADRVPQWVAHGVSHLVVGLPVAALVVVAVRSWPPPASVRPAPWGRRLAVVGLAGIAFGQVLEVLGARVDERDALWVEGAAHTAGQVVTVLSLLTAVFGAVLALVGGARAGTVPRWLAVVVTVLLVALFGFMVFGSPDPNA